MATRSVYDWRRNDANEGTSREFDRPYWTGETRADDGRAGDVLWTCDVEEVGVRLRLDDDCAGDL
jgi:hypothetical protein